MDGHRDRVAGAVLPAGRRGSRVVRPVAVPGGGEPSEAPAHHHAGENIHHIEYWSTARLEGTAGAMASYIQVGLHVCVEINKCRVHITIFSSFFLHLFTHSCLHNSLIIIPPCNKTLIQHQQ